MKRFIRLINGLLIFLMLFTAAGNAGMTESHAAVLQAPGNFSVEVFQYYNKISWVNAETSSYFYTVIEKSIDKGPFYPLTTLFKGTTSFSDYGVSNGHIYTYRAKTYYGSDTSPYTREVEAITLYPTSFNIVRAMHDHVDLSWTYPELPLQRSLAYETIIERRVSDTTSWTQIAVLNSSETSYRDLTVSQDTYYYYRIKTRYSSGVYSYYYPSDYGISTRTAYPLKTPLWGYALSSTQIRLEWDMQRQTDGEAILQRKNAAGDFVNLVSSGYYSSYVDTGLVPGHTYTYRLFFRSKNGMYSEYTDEISVITETVPFPMDISAKAMSSDRIVLFWSYPFEVETGFEVWRRSVGEKWELLDVLPKNSETYTDASAHSGMMYTYMVRAKRGDTAFSSFSQTVTVINEYPVAPQPVVFWAHNSMLTLYSADETPVNGTLTLEYRRHINDTWKDLRTTDEGYISAHLAYTSATEFDFRLRADRNGLISYSPIVRFYGAIPEAPLNLAAPFIGYQKVLLTWKDVGAMEEGYYIYRTVNGKTELIGQVGQSVESFEDKSPVRGAAARYTVTAFNYVGESDGLSINVNVPNPAAFKDIPAGHWAYEAVMQLQGLGALEAGNGYFNPQSTLTRGQAVSMLLKSFRIPHTKQGLYSFADLSSMHTYYKDLMTAVSLGILYPDASDRIYPDKPITRGELLLWLTNALNYFDKPLHAYDTDILIGYSDEYQISQEDIPIAASFVGDGIISGKSGGRLAWKDNATKAEVAVIIYRTLKDYYIGN